MRESPAETGPSTVSIDADDLIAKVENFVASNGYAIVTDVLDSRACQDLIDEVERIERDHQIDVGTSEFEGFHTRRIFNLISRGPRFRDLVIDERILRLVEAILGDGILLSGTTSMHISPGETAQLLHADDGMISLPRPHPATMVTTLWALSEFTKDNGATRLISGSHLEPDRAPESEGDLVPLLAEMPAGSVLVLHASTWHGGGANSTEDVERYGLSIQYVAGWCRQQQNLMLGTSREVVASYPRRLQELIGYSMYRNVMGHVDRQHPLSLLGEEVPPEMVWEKMQKKA
jgi:ectoine hydroxylase-related dioxygenase (phytanoyl-CoA dioxygenase family)